MPGETEKQITDTGGQPASAPSGVSPEELAAAREEAAYYRSLNEQLNARLEPFKTIIEPVLSGDEVIRGAVESAIDTVKHRRSTADTRTDHEKRMEEKIEKLEKRSDEAVAAYELQAARTYVEGLAAKYPFLKENNWSVVNDLEQEAEKELHITAPRDKAMYIERVAKRMGATKPEKEPPESLRADMGEPGIPAAKDEKPLADPQNIREEMIRRARAANR